ncbi:uncharacterized protein LOC124655866 [Lolium rigidum]|uniref:uncharacterized protein LOC124655866 n=1 Tax=Lolium rigidum TaxID=89674 RepID=UPI001F5C1C62|nr:uncharacterized protein LOC124655866 [Lolium rigidum]
MDQGIAGGEMHDPASGASDEGGAWTGQKRPKHQCPSPTRDSGEIGGARTSSSSSDVHAGADHQEPSTEIARVIDMVAPRDELEENDIISDEEFLGYLKVLATRPAPITISARSLDKEEQRKLYGRLALYRARASKLARGVCVEDLDEVTLTKEYSPENLKALLADYEKDDAVDWYFDRNYSSLDDLGDYHRLVLREDGIRYFDWVTYRSSFTSYEIDEEYVKLFEEISKKIKWVKRYMECQLASSEWIEMNNRGFRQAVRIAAGFPRMSHFFALMAFKEHVSDVMFDYWQREDIDRLFFEIWKCMTEKKIDSTAALVEVNRQDIFPRYRRKIQFALDRSDISDLFLEFDTCVEGIPDDAAQDGARELITWAVWNKLNKPKMWHQYIIRKMEIAKHIGLYPQA